MANKRGGNYSPNLNMPGSGAPKSRRGVFGVLLLLILPPLGLLFLWRKEVFRVRGRMVLTLLATVEMGVIVALMMPRSTLSTISPIPGTAERITPAPESEALNALSNMDQLLQAQQAAAATATPEPVSQQDQIAAQQDVLNATVYCVTVSGARFYHTATECDGQQNPRALTVQEALSESLEPCRKCNPPVYNPAGTDNE